MTLTLTNAQNVGAAPSDCDLLRGVTATSPLTAVPQYSSRIHRANLRSALHLAIKNLRQREQRLAVGYCSALRAGLESNLAALKAGETLKIIG